MGTDVTRYVVYGVETTWSAWKAHAQANAHRFVGVATDEDRDTYLNDPDRWPARREALVEEFEDVYEYPRGRKRGQQGLILIMDGMSCDYVVMGHVYLEGSEEMGPELPSVIPFHKPSRSYHRQVVKDLEEVFLLENPKPLWLFVTHYH